MPETNQDLLAIHAHACAAVARANRTLTPDVDAFWPIYLRAALTAPLADVPITIPNDTARLDWLDHNANRSSYFDLVTLTFSAPESFEGSDSLREVIDVARKAMDELQGGDI